MFSERFDCDFINLTELYRRSDRTCQPSVWEQLLSAQQDLKDIAKSLGCDVKDIFTLKGRGRSATCWVHPLVFERWEKWAVQQKLKQSKPEDLRPSASIDVEVIGADAPTVKTWQPEQIEALAKSTERYPVDFEDAWVWIGYSTKGNAKRLLDNFEEEIDFLSQLIKSPPTGRPVEKIYLTTDCFKQFCMMAGTEQGRAVRRYFIECEQKLKHLLVESSVNPKPSHQINADPFIEMIEQDLIQAGVSSAFVKGWKYDALKVLHPDYSAMLESAKRLLMSSCTEIESPVNVSTISQLIDSKYNLKIMPEYLNKLWVQMGLQVHSKTSKCKWVLTEEGKKYGRSVPYHKSEHDGYQILWLTSIVDVTYEYLKAQKQAI